METYHNPTEPEIAHILKVHLENSQYVSRPASGGHMAYQRIFLEAPDSPALFAKGHDATMFSDSEREEHAKAYLQKEQMMFKFLQNQSYTSVPEYTDIVDDRILVMNAFRQEDGWRWRLPKLPERQAIYVEDILESLSELSRIALPEPNHFFPERIMKIYMEEGWDAMSQPTAENIATNITRWFEKFHPQTQIAATQVLQASPELTEAGQKLYDVSQELYLSHHDARQANITWHPEFGTRIVDWSWADVGFKNADTTMFLIDLAKSGYNVNPYMQEYFNPQHALLLLGHWLGRSVEPTRDGDQTVRFHQTASAVTAFSLLQAH